MNDEWHWRIVKLWATGIRTKDQNGLAKRGYLNERYDQIAREFLAKALDEGKPIPGDVGRALASVISTDPSRYLWRPSERMLDFRFRTEGRRRDGIRDYHILETMGRNVLKFDKVEAAVAETSHQLGLSRSAILKVWGFWNERIYILNFLRNAVGQRPEDYIESIEPDDYR
jgi:hypothetical protein